MLSLNRLCLSPRGPCCSVCRIIIIYCFVNLRRDLNADSRVYVFRMVMLDPIYRSVVCGAPILRMSRHLQVFGRNGRFKCYLIMMIIVFIGEYPFDGIASYSSRVHVLSCTLFGFAAICKILFADSSSVKRDNFKAAVNIFKSVGQEIRNFRVFKICSYIVCIIYIYFPCYLTVLDVQRSRFRAFIASGRNYLLRFGIRRLVIDCKCRSILIVFTGAPSHAFSSSRNGSFVFTLYRIV